jgi:hypothetical protein
MKKTLLILLSYLISAQMVAQDLNVRFARCTGCCDQTQCNDVGPITSFTYGRFGR